MGGGRGPAMGVRGEDPYPFLHLFSGPYVTTCGVRHEIPGGSTRLVAFVALRGRPVARRHVAGVLWPVACEGRAAGNLRSALWRLKCAGIAVISEGSTGLFMRSGVRVDLQVAEEWACRLISGDETEDDLRPHHTIDALDLLPGWEDPWLPVERERVRQRVLHALEAQSRALVRAGRIAEGVEAALAAVCAEPLRESAQRRLLEAHLAEGNRVEARRAFAAYRKLLLDEIGVEPSPDLVDRFRFLARPRRSKVAPNEVTSPP